MLERLFQLIILFIVIFDPLASISVFFVATKDLSASERRHTAFLAVLVAAVISFSFLIFGQHILVLFDTTIEDFKAAAGIILGILGIKMVLGESITNIDNAGNNSGRAIAAIIGTPLLTGPAAITTIIVSVHDYGMPITGNSGLYCSCCYNGIVSSFRKNIQGLWGNNNKGHFDNSRIDNNFLGYKIR